MRDLNCKLRIVMSSMKCFFRDKLIGWFTCALVISIGQRMGAQVEQSHFLVGASAGVPFTKTAYYYSFKSNATLEWDVRLTKILWINVGTSIGRTWPAVDPNIFLRHANASLELMFYNPEKHRLGLRLGCANNYYWSMLPNPLNFLRQANNYEPYKDDYWMYSGLLGVIARVGKCTDVSLMCNIETSYTKVDVRSNNLILLCVRRPLWTVTRSAPDANGKRARAVIPFWRGNKKENE